MLWRTCVDGSGDCEMIMVISHGTRLARRLRWTAPRKLRRSIRWPRGDAMGIINSVRCGVNAHVRGPAIETTDCPPNASDEQTSVAWRHGRNVFFKPARGNNSRNRVMGSECD